MSATMPYTMEVCELCGGDPRSYVLGFWPVSCKKCDGVGWWIRPMTAAELSKAVRESWSKHREDT